MRISEAIVRKGVFWKAGREDLKVAGILTIMDGGVSELELIGGLEGGELADLGLETDQDFIVCGRIDSDNFATLYQCYYRRKTHSLTSGVSTSVIKCSKALLGVAPALLDSQLKYRSVYFELENIEPWIDISGFRVIRPHNTNKILVEHELPDQVEATLPGIGSFKIAFNMGIPFRLGNEVNLKQTVAFKLYPEHPLEINTATAIISKIQHFLIFATQQELSLRNVKAILDEGDSKSESGPYIVKWYYESSPFQAEPKAPDNKCLLFTLSDVLENFESYLNRWLQLYRMTQPSMRLYFSVLTGAHRYSEGVNLSLSQAAETYQRQTSGNSNMTFRQRIRELFNPFLSLCNFDIESFLDDAVNTRNYLTHYNDTIKDKSLTGAELYFLNKRIRDVITLSILKDVGLDLVVIERIAREKSMLLDKFS